MTIEHLTLSSFKEKIFDFTNKNDWQYAGDIPCLIDFYADWCGPCKALNPVLEQLAREFDGRVRIYKIDTEKEQDLAGLFGIRSIPSLLFVPKSGQPQMARGLLPKQAIVNAFKEILDVETPSIIRTAQGS